MQMQKQSWWRRAAQRMARVGERMGGTRFDRFQGASGVSERNVTQGTDWGGLYRDRYDYDRGRVIDEAIRAWRLNPLARRIVELQTQYTLDGIDFACDDPATE